MKRCDSKFIARGWSQAWWELLTKGERQMKLAELSDKELDEFFYDWRVWGREEQLAPDWDWDTWLLLTGRGWGKTRTAVEFLLDKIEHATVPLRIAIVGQGEDDIRTVMVEGKSGFINCSPPWNKPIYYASKGGGVMVWPNGCQAFIYSAADSEGLRGPEFHYGWFDEPMAVPRAQRVRSLDNLEFCLRLGEHAQLIITTTPKPDPWLRSMEREAKDPENKIAITRGNTNDNAKNLAPNFLRKIKRKYANTRTGRQEIEGKILGDEEGALWTEGVLDERRVPAADPVEFAATCDKTVVSVDPNTKNNAGQKKARKIAHAAGIVICGKKGPKRYVLGDRSTKGGPNKWVPAAVDAVEEFGADEIVVEVNQGGDMAKMLLQQELQARGMSCHIHTNFAKRSKEGRAEPVSRMYDRGDVYHVGAAEQYEDLEMQMCYLHEDEDPTGEDFDRCDALVWGITRLGLKKKASSGNSSRSVGFSTLGGLNGSTYERGGGGDQGGWGSSEL